MPISRSWKLNWSDISKKLNDENSELRSKLDELKVEKAPTVEPFQLKEPSSE